MRRLWTSIRVKLTVATLLPMVCAIAICWVIGVSIITTRFSSQALQSVASNLNSAHEIFISDLARLSDIVRLTGQSPELTATLAAPQNDTLLPTLQAIVRNERLSFLTVVDRYGFVRFRAANPQLKGDRRITDKLVADALKGAPVSGVTVLTSAQAERENPLLPRQLQLEIKATVNARKYTKKIEERGLFQVAAAPIMAADGTLAGVVYAGVLLNNDNHLIERITQVVFQRGETDVQQRGNTTIFLDDVRIATSVLNEQGKPAIGTLMSEEVYNTVARGETWHGSAFVLNSRYFTAYEPLRDLKGSVVGVLYVGMPESTLLQLRWQVHVIFAAVLFFVSMVGVMLSAWLGASMSRPVRALEEGVRRIAAGEQLPDIVVDSRDEIASLAGEFNAMKRRLQEREAENQALNRTLEEKVVERTVQLEEKSQQLLHTQKELARAERLADIGILASGVAHEINNPLAIIRGNAELLELTAQSGCCDLSEVTTIMQQVGRVERIVGNLLTFARTKQLAVQRFQLHGVLDDILDQVGHQIPLDRYQLRRHYPEGDDSLHGDEGQLRQVFTNLVLNGLQAMPDGGTLDVSVILDEQTGCCRVVIADTGMGIATDAREKLFTPFFTTKSRGTGLGLAVSYGIVKDHGGAILVESEVGSGSTFTVVLPLKQE